MKFNERNLYSIELYHKLCPLSGRFSEKSNTSHSINRALRHGVHVRLHERRDHAYKLVRAVTGPVISWPFP